MLKITHRARVAWESLMSKQAKAEKRGRSGSDAAGNAEERKPAKRAATGLLPRRHHRSIISTYLVFSHS